MAVAAEAKSGEARREGTAVVGVDLIGNAHKKTDRAKTGVSVTEMASRYDKV